MDKISPRGRRPPVPPHRPRASGRPDVHPRPLRLLGRRRHRKGRRHRPDTVEPPDTPRREVRQAEEVLQLPGDLQPGEGAEAGRKEQAGALRPIPADAAPRDHARGVDGRREGVPGGGAGSRRAPSLRGDVAGDVRGDVDRGVLRRRGRRDRTGRVLAGHESGRGHAHGPRVRHGQPQQRPPEAEHPLLQAGRGGGSLPPRGLGEDRAGGADLQQLQSMQPVQRRRREIVRHVQPQPHAGPVRELRVRGGPSPELGVRSRRRRRGQQRRRLRGRVRVLPGEGSGVGGAGGAVGGRGRAAGRTGRRVAEDAVPTACENIWRQGKA
mmetsp:Transcript_33091/g.70536  ORF Transcript_33091/g.70536 Transcript_33091/m.70536 type:complete len:324 (+) Transcript_33091:267-1238(+)